MSITLGIAGLVTVLCMGEAIEKKIAVNLELLGSATIIKASWDFDRKNRWHNGKFRPGDIQDLRKIERIVEVTGFVRIADQTFVRQQNKIQGQLMRVESNFFSAVHIAFSEGSAITEEFVSSRVYVCGGRYYHEGGSPVFQGRKSRPRTRGKEDSGRTSPLRLRTSFNDEDFMGSLMLPVGFPFAPIHLDKGTLCS